MTIIKKNFMGTLDIVAKFKGMRKEQEFTSYRKESNTDNLTIQSDTRIGYINTKNGVVYLCKPKANGAYFHDLMNVAIVDVISTDDLKIINDLLDDCPKSTLVRIL